MNTLYRVICYFKPYRSYIVFAALASTFVGAMDGAIAYLVEPMLKRIFSENDKTIFHLLPLGVIILFLIRGISRFSYEVAIKTAGQKAIQDIRNETFEKNVFLSLGYFNRQTTGALMSRILNDITVMQDGIAAVVCGTFRELIATISLLGVIFYRNWKLALISFVVIPLTAYPAQLIGRRIKKSSALSLGVMGGISSILQETFSGIKVIKAFALEQRTTLRFRGINLDYFTHYRKFIKYESMATPVAEIIISFGVATVIYVGGSDVMQGRMTAAEFFSFLTAMVLVFNPIKKLMNSYNTLQRSVGAAERVFEVLDEVPEIRDMPDARKLGRVMGEVEFRDVSFSYHNDPILKGISLRAKRNEVIALVGPSGSGKTTLVSLIPRFYDPTAGAILIDDLDIRSVTLKSLADQIALVDQETILFNDTIANNIRYGKHDATDEEVEAAAQAGYAHDFILQLPQAYETNIGDRGVRLSGGQRQRICIARALLKNAPVLILDEATSALDTESEQMVQKALDNLMVDRTTFVIAHRLSTVLHADRIIVLDKGIIADEGRHEDLIAKDGLYSRLHAMQFRDAPADNREPVP